MRKVIVKESSKTLFLNDVKGNTPVFVKWKNKLVGLLIQETQGWIIKTAGTLTYGCYFSTRERCGLSAIEDHGFELCIEE